MVTAHSVGRLTVILTVLLDLVPPTETTGRSLRCPERHCNENSSRCLAIRRVLGAEGEHRLASNSGHPKRFKTCRNYDTSFDGRNHREVQVVMGFTQRGLSPQPPVRPILCTTWLRRRGGTLPQPLGVRFISPRNLTRWWYPLSISGMVTKLALTRRVQKK